jgi:hypothetical protein
MNKLNDFRIWDEEKEKYVENIYNIFIDIKGNIFEMPDGYDRLILKTSYKKEERLRGIPDLDGKDVFLNDVVECIIFESITPMEKAKEYMKLYIEDNFTYEKGVVKYCCGEYYISFVGHHENIIDGIYFRVIDNSHEYKGELR